MASPGDPLGGGGRGCPAWVRIELRRSVESARPLDDRCDEPRPLLGVAVRVSWLRVVERVRPTLSDGDDVVDDEAAWVRPLQRVVDRLAADRAC